MVACSADIDPPFAGLPSVQSLLCKDTFLEQYGSDAGLKLSLRISKGGNVTIDVTHRPALRLSLRRRRIVGMLRTVGDSVDERFKDLLGC